MKVCNFVAVLIMCAMISHANGRRMVSAGSMLNRAMARYSVQIVQLKKTIADLSRQVMLQQFFVEEKIRSDGSSGIKLIRGGRKGLHNYDSNTHLSNSYMAIHDHSNYDRTIGMGEVSVVLNGLEFRTRHNDYKLYMPDANSDDYNAVVKVPFPGVPPEVTNLPTVEEQIVEMREWFRAFWTQNATHRNYPQYFKPVMAYMEGAWTYDDSTITESFSSDRHKLAAKSWFELQEKVRFSAMSGVKDLAENLAYLPTTITNVNGTTGKNTYAQWNYRVMCYPIEQDISFFNFRQIEDMAPRVSRDWTRFEVMDRRLARFSLTEPDQDPKNWYTLLDKIMYQIPGKDNRYKNSTQDVFGNGFMYDIGHGDDNVKLDTSRYHRWYRSSEKDAMGVSVAARGFNDDYLFVAQTSQPKVVSLSITDCKRRHGRRRCEDITNSFTYAIPIEIIFLTPLLSWNPYNLKIHEGKNIANRDGRDGSEDTEAKAYDGVDSINYYMTPVDFFKGFVTEDPADTVRNAVYVKGPDGKNVVTTSSGTQIMLQEIEGVGRVRTRYPVAPVHGEGNSVWRELNALRDTVTGQVNGPPEVVEMEMENNGTHTHTVGVNYADFLYLVNDRMPITVTTDIAFGHSHELELIYSRRMGKIRYRRCDGASRCADDHDRTLEILNPSVFTELP